MKKNKITKETNIEIPLEIQEYLETIFKVQSKQVKMDINKYLNTLPPNEQQDTLDEIYEWKIIGRKNEK